MACPWSVWGNVSDARFVWFRPPELIRFDQRVEDRQKFSHCGGECHFLLFPLSNQSLVKGFDLWIESGGGECGHVENAADSGTTAAGSTLAGDLTGIAVHRSHTHEACNLSSIEFSEFRQLCQKRADRDWSKPFDRLHNFDFACIDSVCGDAFGETLINRFHPFFQGFQ